jgi:hypothetical protein
MALPTTLKGLRNVVRGRKRKRESGEGREGGSRRERESSKGGIESRSRDGRERGTYELQTWNIILRVLFPPKCDVCIPGLVSVCRMMR